MESESPRVITHMKEEIMGTIFEKINKAEYVFRPRQLLKRFSPPVKDEEICHLPWSYDLKVRTQDNIGKAVWNLGLYDLVVSEALARIAQTTPAGSILIDAGANIGHMSSIMDCFSPDGTDLFSYEPHPAIFKQLVENIERWPSRNKTKPINKALSEASGDCDFFIPSGFSGNQGLGFIASSSNERLIKSSEKLARVAMTTLDQEHLSKSIHLMKVDTEGSELLVLKGAQKLLVEKRIHNIVFEDHDLYPTPLMTFLESHGFTIFSLQRGLLGPKITSGRENKKETWEPNSFLATLRPGEVSFLMSKKGWLSLS